MGLMAKERLRNEKPEVKISSITVITISMY